MKSYLVFFILICSTYLLHAQRFYRSSSQKLNQLNQENLKQGKWVELSGDKVKSITNYKDDQLHGLIIKYWSNGHLKSEEEFRNNIPHGYFNDYYRTGDRNRNGNYNRGQKNGEFKKYWPNGELRTQSSFENDIEHGKTIEYYKDGTLKREIPYDQGVVKGDVRMYSKKGELVRSKTYVGSSVN